MFTPPLTVTARDAELLTLFDRDQNRRGLLPRTVRHRRKILHLFLKANTGGFAEADKESIEAWLDRCMIGGRSRSSYISNLNAFYTWAVSAGKLRTNPLAEIARPKVRRTLPRPMANDDLARAMAAADSMMKCWLSLAAFEGLRCQEIAGLDAGDVLAEDGLLRVVDGKGGHEALLPLHPDVLAALQALPMPRVGPVFTRPRGGRWTPEAVSITFNEFLHENGIKSTAHSLRHWFGTNVYEESGCDLRVTQELMRHSSPQTTAIYAAFNPERARSAVVQLKMKPASNF